MRKNKIDEIKTDVVTFESVPVLIIGAGAAGARTAIELQQRHTTPLVVSKRDHGDAHTTWARGGINASLANLDEEDSWEIHAADTLEEGHLINDPEAVELVAKNMPDRIRELEHWGMEFSKTDDGEINQRYFGAQSYRRTCFAGDHTGESMLDTLVDIAQSLGIPYRDNVMITHLTERSGEVTGAVGYDMKTGDKIAFVADQVVVAAGGATSMYNRHSSRELENNADGVSLAARAGAELIDMEFIQFHPTGMVGYGDEWDGRLVTEAVRGEGGKLYNDEGERFMKEYSPDQMELDARDVVARAIETEVDEGRGTENGGVWLDISHRDRDFIKQRLPRMYERFQSIGVDISEEPMEVAPTAHYTMGGVEFDPHTGETGVDGLRVVGETTAGVHGANRLGGNSLAETVAIGQEVGESIAKTHPRKPLEVSESTVNQAQSEFERLDNLHDGNESVDDIASELGNVLEQYVGISRDEAGLKTALKKVQNLRERYSSVGVKKDITSVEYEYAVDLRFMLLSAECLIKSALKRKESRGAHYREDFPNKDSEMRVNIVSSVTDGNITLEKRDVSVPSEKVQEALDEGYELDYHHLE